MTEQELHQARLLRWRTEPERKLLGVEEAAGFMADVGMCLLFPTRPALVAPTFIGACVGSEDRLPTAQQAFADARSGQAREWMVRLLRQKLAFEAPLDGENVLLLAPEIFPYFYALTGERNPKNPADQKLSVLARDAYAALQQHGPLAKHKLAERLGGEPSGAALDRALHELWSRLLITRVDYSPAEGATWELLHRYAPDMVKQGSTLSLIEALSALLSKYLDAVVAAEAAEIEAFFARFSSRGRVREAMNALLAARELSFVQVGRRTLVRITPAAVPPEARVRKKPAARRAV